MPEPGDDQSAIAHHEAGHVLAARVLGRPVALVTIIPRGDCNGAMLREMPMPDAIQKSVDEETRDISELCARARSLIPIGESRTPAAGCIVEFLDHGIELLAGPEAERKLSGGKAAVWGRADAERARLYAAAITVYPEAAPHYFDLFRRQAETIVHRHWHSIVAIAQALIDRQTLTADEINLIIAEAEAEHTVASAQAHRLAWRQTVERAEQYEAQFTGGLLAEWGRCPRLSLVQPAPVCASD